MEAAPELESSPELSESFELYLQMRKERAVEEKSKLLPPTAAASSTESPRSSRRGIFKPNSIDKTIVNLDNTMTQFDDDSFLANEKMCEQTLHLNNVSELTLIDLTALDMTTGLGRTSKASTDETHLNDVEAPSFMFNNTSMVSASPNKHSPLIMANANRPSTILEVTEASTSRTFMSSYRTAVTGSGTESVYKTANEESFDGDDNMMIKMPPVRSFYDANSPKMKSLGLDKYLVMNVPKPRSLYDVNMTKDSLDSDKTNVAEEITKDSLDPDTFGSNSSSGVESGFDQPANGSSFDHHDEPANEPSFDGHESVNQSAGDNFNDTLERFEFMLAQGQKLKETPKTIPQSPVTPRFVAKPSPNPTPSSKYLQPRVFNKQAVSASKASPLIKFSPAVKKSPMVAGPAFKKPTASASKVPQHSSARKYINVESPIARYMYDTPGAPLSSTKRDLPGIGGSASKHFNFRDSEGSFTKENTGAGSAYKGSSLPFRAKTKSSAVSHVSLRVFKKILRCSTILFFRYSINETLKHRVGLRFSHFWERVPVWWSIKDM